MNKMNRQSSMQLHIFNPEHDMALAANQRRFTAPHAGRRMRADLGFIPALWAGDGDLVLVDDTEAAAEAVRHIRRYAHSVRFVTPAALRGAVAETGGALTVSPWGWDLALKHQLLRADSALEPLLPSDAALDAMRQMSSRRFAAERLLPVLHDSNPGVVGESCYCESEDEAASAMRRYGASVLKSPWSCSGRGVRYVPSRQPDGLVDGWMRNVMRRQGGIMVEPLYPKVYDFGIEFEAQPVTGDIVYRGLSLFATRGGAYTGSICATEADKREMLSRYVDLKLLDRICLQIQTVLKPLFAGRYSGPFGIDMMAIARDGGSGFWLHPCVELNLRRTMGHVALALTPTEMEPRRIMSVYFQDKYRIRVQNNNDNLLNTGLV